MKSLSSMASKVVFTLASVALVQLAAAAPKSQGELAVAIRYLRVCTESQRERRAARILTAAMRMKVSEESVRYS